MLIDGKHVSKKILEQLKTEWTSFSKHHRATSAPGLAFILIGNHAAPHTYVKMKQKTCHELGIYSRVYALDSQVSQRELLDLIISCNHDPSIHGILVQQPVPAHLSEQTILEAVDPRKDVDGFHPTNVGKLLLGFDDGFISCTPYGILMLLKEYHVDLTGKNVVIIGRSNIVGKPLASLLVQKKPFCNATVTLAHSQTKNLEALTEQADVVVAAIGKPLFIKASMIKKGAVVIDVGINTIEINGQKKIVGDVDFDSVKEKASLITPVPGGVGPMTIAMLMQNLIKSYKSHLTGLKIKE